MRKTLRFCSAACAAIGVLMLTPTAISAQAFQGYVKIKGKKQGQFKGESTQQGSSSAIETTSGAAAQKPSARARRR
jgi:hypothetical protein